jgi:glyoxylase-like metal-dependent hydrolase (beta-lactamase superfamily II)
MHTYKDNDIDITINQINMGPYANNGYIITCNATNQSIIIDTPAEPEKIINQLSDTKVKHILITHGHQDHLLGFKEICDFTNAPVSCHQNDAGLLPHPPNDTLTHNQVINFGNQQITAIFTPGHTDGSTCYLIGKHLFSGDTLFPGGPGKSRSHEALIQEIESISTKLLTLDPNTSVYPGHGTNTTITNASEQFSVFSSKPHDNNLCGDVSWLDS